MYPQIKLSDTMYLSMYSTFYVLAMVIAVVIVYLEVRRHKNLFKSGSNLLNEALQGAFWTILSGLIGSKILFILMNHAHDFLKHPVELITRSGGYVYYGAEISGILGLMIYLKIRKLPVLTSLDTGSIALAAAHGFGRIGCFMAGCCGGVPTDSPLGVCFPDNPHVAVHPTQLYETIPLLLFATVIWIYRKRIRVPGRITSLYLMTYGVIRFIIEVYRETAYPFGFLNISPNQYIATLQFCMGAVLFVITTKLASKHS